MAESADARRERRRLRKIVRDERAKWLRRADGLDREWPASYGVRGPRKSAQREACLRAVQALDEALRRMRECALLAEVARVALEALASPAVADLAAEREREQAVIAATREQARRADLLDSLADDQSGLRDAAVVGWTNAAFAAEAAVRALDEKGGAK